MTYKESLFFIGKCLTISHEEENLLDVTNKIKSNQVDWEAIVKVSTAHYVFPTIYCNLERNGLLTMLPQDLTSYMKHISDLNRERNMQIIEQAKEVNTLLLKNGITPIFLKGTGFLLQDFYIDIAERMNGDIDILVSEEDFYRSIEVLKDDGYKNIKDDNSFYSRHYPKMVKPSKVSSIEIHHRMTTPKFSRHFNYKTVKDTIISYQGIHFLSFQDQLLLTCLNNQVNNQNYWFKHVNFRSYYDLYLISKKVKTTDSLKSPKIKPLILNTFLGSCAHFLSSPETIQFFPNKTTDSYLEKQLLYIDNPKKQKVNMRFWSQVFNMKKAMYFLSKSLYSKKYRSYILKKLSS